MGGSSLWEAVLVESSLGEAVACWRHYLQEGISWREVPWGEHFLVTSFEDAVLLEQFLQGQFLGEQFRRNDSPNTNLSK